MRLMVIAAPLLALACGEPDRPTTEVVPIEPAAAAAPAEAPPAAVPAEATTTWICPMCAGVESDQPGDCPKCGMALVQPEDAAAVDHADCPQHAATEQ